MKITSDDALRISTQFRELAGRFRRIAARAPSDVATEMNAAEENGARIVNEAVELGIKMDAEGFEDFLTKAKAGSIPWKMIWLAVVHDASRRAPEYFGPNPYSIRWQPLFVQSESHGPVRMGETDGKNWAVRAENFAVVADQLSALCVKIANRLDVSDGWQIMF